ncbi:MAG: hypothetical protein R3F39_26165 [Myxococcota bacterium]
MDSAISTRVGALLLLGISASLSGAACGGEGGASSAADVGGDLPSAALALGRPCQADSDCLSGQCLESEYGVPFCSRACDDPAETCSAGPDAPAGATLCVGFDPLPQPNVPPFKGELTQFCVPTCADTADCESLGAAWEICAPAQYLGDRLYPTLGVGKQVCQAPSFQGKDPVDPRSCDWEKTVRPGFGSEAVLCERYCAYLELCKEIPQETPDPCCAWGCFNRMVIAGETVDLWRDTVKCYVDNHGAFPLVGAANACNQPPKNCGGAPVDPTPPGSGSAL